MSLASPPVEAAEETRRVFEHHLAAFSEGIDAVLSDYAQDAVLVTPEAVHRGLGEIRHFFQGFFELATPAFWAAFEARVRHVEGEIAYLLFSSPPVLPLATDTLVVRGGKIRAQTFTAFKS